MEQLQKAVADSFSKIVSTGAIEQIIEKELTVTVGKILNDELRSYSDFGKALAEYVKSALQVDFRHLGLPGYNDFVLKAVRAQIDANISNVLNSQLNEQMTSLLQPAPSEITLSALVADFIEFNKENDYCSCDSPSKITLIVEDTSYGSRWIALDKKPNVEKYHASIRFLVSEHDQTIGALTVDDKDMKKTLFVGSLYGFERKLFQMHAAGTKLIIDTDVEDISLYYPGHD